MQSFLKKVPHLKNFIDKYFNAEKASPDGLALIVILVSLVKMLLRYVCPVIPSGRE